MKVSEKVKAFEPIELTVTIESEEELVMLWHNLNVNLSAMLYDERYWMNYRYLKKNYKHDQGLWDVINRKVEKLGLRKKLIDE